MCLASIRFVYIKSIFILKKLYFSLIPVFRNFINHFRYHFLIYYFILLYACFVFCWFLILTLLFSSSSLAFNLVFLCSWDPSICYWFFSLSSFLIFAFNAVILFLSSALVYLTSFNVLSYISVQIFSNLCVFFFFFWSKVTLGFPTYLFKFNLILLLTEKYSKRILTFGNLLRFYL